MITDSKQFGYTPTDLAGRLNDLPLLELFRRLLISLLGIRSDYHHTSVSRTTPKHLLLVAPLLPRSHQADLKGHTVSRV